TNPEQPVLIERVVTPESRRNGLGRALVDATQEPVTEHAPDIQPTTAWTHGHHPAARGLAASAGLEPARILYRMALEIARESFGGVDPADTYIIRTVVPGDDDAEWLSLNATAFADPPEQGQLTQADLDARKAEDWFDPAGFFVAENTAGTLV